MFTKKKKHRNKFRERVPCRCFKDELVGSDSEKPLVRFSKGFIKC